MGRRSGSALRQLAATAAAAALLSSSSCLLPPCRAAGSSTSSRTDDAVAIVGGGIAGTTTALHLLLRGYTNVTLYESSPDLTSSTSAVIAGTVNFDTNYRFLGAANDPDFTDALEWIGVGLDGPWSDKERFVNFIRNAKQESGGVRNAKVQKRRVYRRSYEKMRAMIVAYPRLCEALVGDWCCRAGGEAAGYLERATGLACPPPSNGTADSDGGTSGSGGGSPFGRFELLGEKCDEVQKAASNAISGCDDESYGTDRASCLAAGHGYQDGVQYDYYDVNETLIRAGDFVRSGDGVECSVVCRRLTGYVRTEELFVILGDILTTSPAVSVKLGCEVTELGGESGGESGAGRIAVRSACGDDAATAFGGSGIAAYDKVVVAASTASVPLLNAIDPSLDTNLMGFRGHGVYGRPGDGSPVVGPTQVGRSVHFVASSGSGKAAYARSTANGTIKIWGGLYPDPTDDDVRPPYEPPTQIFALDLFVDSPAPEIAGDVYKSNSDNVETGVRPVPAIGNVPLIKRYRGRGGGDGEETAWLSNLYLNTGYGFNGYDLAWFASDCVVAWMDEGVLNDRTCRTATFEGAEKNDDFPLWAIILICVLGTLSVCVCCCVIFKVVRGKKDVE